MAKKDRTVKGQEEHVQEAMNKVKCEICKEDIVCQ